MKPSAYSNKKFKSAGMMAQLVKGLLHKNEELNSNSQHPYKKATHSDTH